MDTLKTLALVGCGFVSIYLVAVLVVFILIIRKNEEVDKKQAARRAMKLEGAKQRMDSMKKLIPEWIKRK